MEEAKSYKMHILPILACLVLACGAAPTDFSSIVINEKLFKKDYVIYTAQHDIVKIFVPFKQFNFDASTTELDVSISSSSSSEESESPRTVFFAEADITNGEKTDKGLYVYKNGKATKLNDNGRDAVATNENVIYIGASDGIYKYDEAANTVAKHGTVNDDIIQMAHNNLTNDLYYLTVNHEVFKLNVDATTSVKSNVTNVQQFAFGFEGNMYYYDTEKNMYVVSDESNAVPKKFGGLPTDMNKVTLISPPYGIEEGTIVVVDKSLYRLNPDGTVVKSKVSLEVEPTAFAPQPTLIQFYAKDKKLYEFNMVAIVMGGLLNELKDVLTNTVNTIRGTLI